MRVHANYDTVLTDMAPEPFSIRIYLADGTADGIRVVEKPGWTGCAVICPRTRFAGVRERREFGKPGVYLLLGDAMGDQQQQEVYIGEGDPIANRLLQHFREKDFWSTVAFFTSRDENLHKAHLQFLESRLIRLAQDANRCHLANANTPEEPSLSEIDQADMRSFLGQLLLVLNVVGIGIFQRPTAATFATTIYNTEAKGLHAEGYETDDGFVVRAGSQSPIEEVPTCPPAIRAARAELRQQKIFRQQGDSLVLTRDYLFSSPSQAAAVILARSANRRIEWKTKDGRTLKAVQEEPLGNPNYHFSEGLTRALLKPAFRRPLSRRLIGPKCLNHFFDLFLKYRVAPFPAPKICRQPVAHLRSLAIVPSAKQIPVEIERNKRQHLRLAFLH
jgi:hypothetical protein